MGYDYSISLEGVRTAENRINQAAGKISRFGARIQSGGYDKSVKPVEDTVDIAGAMVEVKQAKIAAEANLKVLSLQMDLEEETLDLFG
jgi:hypothetical protein